MLTIIMITTTITTMTIPILTNITVCISTTIGILARFPRILNAPAQ